MLAVQFQHQIHYLQWISSPTLLASRYSAGTDCHDDGRVDCRSSWAGWRPHLTDQSSKQNVPTAVPKISTRLISEMVATAHASPRMASEFQDVQLPLMTSSRVGKVSGL